ncbi:MAG: hypothetical protein QOK15_2566, partial [Nocardioidaceae bacterium]|nr:hypothetical protein [Nocardioidaceae bacterium]
VYLPRMGGLRPAPMDADYALLVSTAEVWVAEVDDGIAGFLVLVLADDHMLLDNLAVRPVWQGHDIGRRFLALAEERAHECGRDLVRLYTHVVMVENQRLYERIGYVETARQTEHGLARVFYEKHLPPLNLARR